jgi:hypothetical protein
VVSGFEIRVGDAEREAVAAELREHFASGRLTQDELNERLDQAFAAKTRGDLHALTTDLPSAQAWWAADAAPPGAGHGHGHHHGWQREGRPTAGTLVASSVMLWALLALLALGLLGIFGIGGGLPFGFALIIAAFALLRRIIIGIFRRRRGGSRGPRRRR